MGGDPSQLPLLSLNDSSAVSLPNGPRFGVPTMDGSLMPPPADIYTGGGVGGGGGNQVGALTAANLAWLPGSSTQARPLGDDMQTCAGETSYDPDKMAKDTASLSSLSGIDMFGTDEDVQRAKERAVADRKEKEKVKRRIMQYHVKENGAASIMDSENDSLVSKFAEIEGKRWKALREGVLSSVDALAWEEDIWKMHENTADERRLRRIKREISRINEFRDPQFKFLFHGEKHSRVTNQIAVTREKESDDVIRNATELLEYTTCVIEEHKNIIEEFDGPLH